MIGRSRRVEGRAAQRVRRAAVRDGPRRAVLTAVLMATLMPVGVGSSGCASQRIEIEALPEAPIAFMYWEGKGSQKRGEAFAVGRTAEFHPKLGLDAGAADAAAAFIEAPRHGREIGLREIDLRRRRDAD